MNSSSNCSGQSRVAAFTRRLLPEQFVRYLFVGLWNMAFGYASFAFFTALLDKVVPQSYLAGNLLSNIASITVAFLGYKWFVFKTKGNYLKEWCRCVGVYSGGIVLGLVLLPMIVFTIRHKFGYQKEAPYIAGALLAGITAILGFFGHKHISFRS
jgi:putative flippase GtrA